MAGIYIHIPFCRKACHYCDFHFTTSLRYKNDLLQAIFQEIKLQKEYLFGKSIQTIYLGGGTPSILSVDELSKIFEVLAQSFDLSNLQEITMECNPDDLTPRYLKSLTQTPINRLSIGVQSFFKEDLEYMNRSHTSSQAKASILDALEIGFLNLTVDLIYGYDLLTTDKLTQNLTFLIEHNIPHISAYGLTIEQNTYFGKLHQKNQLRSPEENLQAQHFNHIFEYLSNHKYEQYEISNYCQPGQYAVHNSNYWNFTSYLGIGPSAHSYNGISRRWNVRNNNGYIRSILEGKNYFEEEKLTLETRFNEYMLTSLRTYWGVDLNYIETTFGERFKNTVERTAVAYLQNGYLNKVETIIQTTQAGKLIADRIASDFFVL